MPHEGDIRNGDAPKKSKKIFLPCGRPLPKKNFVIQPELSWRNKLDVYITSNELRRSGSRSKLIAVVFKQQGHFTTSELIKRVKAIYPGIGTASVYRNLPILIGADLLRETLTDDLGQKYYEVARDDHHDHIVCLDCNQFFEFHDERIENAQVEVSKRLNFDSVKYKHVIYAACEYKKTRGN